MLTRTSVQLSSLITAVICGVLILALTWCVIMAVWSYNWPTTTGVVTQSYATHSRSRRGSNRTHIHLAIEYQVDGQTYKTSNVTHFALTSEPDIGEETLNRDYYRGRRLELYYCPTFPSMAVVDNSIPGWVAVVMFLAFFVGILAAYLAYYPETLTNLQSKPQEVAREGTW
jgi:hypothetical protein